jgi:hypothetical protein
VTTATRQRSSSASTRDARRRGRSSRRSRGALVWVAVVVVVLLAVVVGAIAVLLAGADLQRGRTEALAARQALLAGNLDDGAAALAEADAAFARARDGLRGPLVLPLRAVPVVRQNVLGVAALASSGQRATSAAVSLTAVEGGDPLQLLSPRDGALPVAAIAELAPQAQQAQERLAAAAAEARAIDGRWILGPVVDARAELLGELVGVERAATGAARLAEALPPFLGHAGPRRYFFGAASPSELRGATGLVGAYSLADVRDGRLSFSDFRPVQELPTFPPGEIPAADPSLELRYDRYGGTGFWLNINMTADFPSAATAIERLFERGTGTGADGVIIATPRALAALMQVSGPVDIPGYGTLQPEDAIEVLGNEAYGDIEDPAERKLILGAAAKEVLQRFLSGEGDPVQSARVLAEVAAAGDLLLHSTRPEEQAAFEAAGIAGQLAADGGDHLAVTGNNAAGNKLDFYMDRAISYDALLLPAGEVRSTTTVRLANDAPTRGLPPYIIGPYPTTDLAAGENLTILSTYCGAGCGLRSFERDGEPEPVTPEVELGHPVFTSLVQLASGEETELRYAWARPDVWEGTLEQGRYRFTFTDQATIRPTQLDVSIALPDGVDVTFASPGVTIRDGVAHWSGEPAAAQRIEVEWRTAPTQRLRRALASLFLERTGT